MNIEDSKELLVTALRDLPSKQGEFLQIAPDMMLSAEVSFTDATKSVTWLDGRYVMLHYANTESGRFTSHRSVHTVVNFIPDAVVKEWAISEPHRPKNT